MWQEPAIETIKTEASHGRMWRYAELNFCRVGGPHFKKMRFLTNAPTWATAHMELLCDHKFKHPHCAGRDGEGVARTAKSAAYPHTLVRMIVGVAEKLIAGKAVLECASLESSARDAARPANRKRPRGGANSTALASNKTFSHWPVDGGVPSTKEYRYVHWITADMAECYMVRHKLRLYWERTRDLPAAADPGGVEAVRVEDRVPREVREQVLPRSASTRRSSKAGAAECRCASRTRSPSSS